MSEILGRGVYSFAEAAKLTRLSPQRVREWFLGRESARTPVFHSDFPLLGSMHAISFLDLVEVFVAGHLRSFGVSLPTVRKVHVRLAEDFECPHPFARKELRTDGQAVFVHGIDRTGQAEVYDALTRQKAFPQIILPFLKRIDYDRLSALATSWNIEEGVIIDPGKCFGRPAVKRTYVPTYLIAAEFKANGRNAEKVAGWYNLTPDEVMDAVRFENGLAA